MDPLSIYFAFNMSLGVVAMAMVGVLIYETHKDIKKERFEVSLKKSLEKNREWYIPKDKNVEYSINPMFSVAYLSR